MTVGTSRTTGLLELVATIPLAVATVGTAWSSYQASRWNGEQATAFSRAGASRVESSKSASVANSQTQIDVATFTQWVDAYAQNQTELADFYVMRFREDFRPAMDAWVATRPLMNPDTPLTPFVLPEYQVEARGEADRLEPEAEGWSATARRNIQRATNYVPCVVLSTAVLFFSGMSTKLESPHLRWVLLGLGVIIFVGTVGGSPPSRSASRSETCNGGSECLTQDQRRLSRRPLRSRPAGGDRLRRWSAWCWRRC